MHDFAPILQATLTPVALISGVGLLLLSMTNRYNHAIDRVRQLLKERPHRHGEGLRKLERSIEIIYKRCRVMRNAILAIVLSIAASGVLVLLIALERILSVSFGEVKTLILVSSVGLIVVATMLFVIDVTYSLRALELEIED